jgi:hypothetical protein
VRGGQPLHKSAGAVESQKKEFLLNPLLLFRDLPELVVS